MRAAAARQWTVQDVAESYALWWREAGLHSAVSAEAHGWLADPVQEAPAPVETARPVARLAQPAPAAPIRPVANPAGRAMPGDLAAFREWLAQAEDQPESGWPGPVFLPSATANARLVVITDMPDDGAGDPALPFAPSTARFMTAMLAAIGLTPGEVAFAPLAVRRPPGGLLDERSVKTLATRMRHYLGLARPQAALILGDRTSRALIAVRDAGPAGSLPHINHDGGTLPVAALAAPELLMRRPMAKAASWQTLRLLTGAMNP